MRFKPSEILRFLGGLALAAVMLGFVVLRLTSCAPTPRPTPPPRAAPMASRARALPAPTPTPAPAPPPTPGACADGPTAAAQSNAASLKAMSWSPFGRAEIGWETYAPLVAREIRTDCPPETPGFAGALAAWETSQNLPADGLMSAGVFDRLQVLIEMRRPFERLTARGVCPDPPAASALAQASLAEGYGGEAVQLRPGALAAYRRMAAAARADPAVAGDPRNLTIFSGFRSPAADAERCVRERNCATAARATCSAHRTGLAVDLYVGQAPGFGPDSSADANRRFMSQTPAYRWLVANADRFGFVPYPFEPWHWEWTGEPP